MTYPNVHTKSKVECHPITRHEETVEGGGGDRGKTLHSLLLRWLIGGGVVNAMLSLISSWGRDPVPLLQEAEWASEPRTGLVRKISTYRVLYLGLSTLNKSLYRLHYLGRQFTYSLVIILRTGLLVNFNARHSWVTFLQKYMKLHNCFRS